MNREEQIEAAISRLTKQLLQTSSEISSDESSAKDFQDKRKKIVKQICDLKVKLVKIKEDEDRCDFDEVSSHHSSSGLYFYILLSHMF